MPDRDKKYRDLNTYLRERFGSKVYKLALSGGMTCPNRDGTCGSRGCIFCSEGGSGDFAAPAGMPVSEQLAWAKEKLKTKLGAEFASAKYIAYFQSYTNTYAQVEYLRRIFTEAISDTSVCALSIGTRPDCLPDEVIELLRELNGIKPVWVELGLQTVDAASAEFIRRGYELPVFEDAVKRLKAAGIEIIVHVILGLPGETREAMLKTVKYVGGLYGLSDVFSGIRGIKLQLLHIMSGTDLGDLFVADPKAFGVNKADEKEAENSCGRRDPDKIAGEASQQNSGHKLQLAIQTPEEYIDILIEALELLPEGMVIHRLTGDAPHEKLLFPLWSANKRTTLNGIIREMKIRDTYQGRQCP